MNTPKIVVLLAGTGYWHTDMFPIGGSFHRTVFDTPVTVERTFKNCHGATAAGRIVATNLPVAFPLHLTRELLDSDVIASGDLRDYL